MFHILNEHIFEILLNCKWLVVPGAGTGPGRSRPENFHTHFQRSLCEIRWC